MEHLRVTIVVRLTVVRHRKNRTQQVKHKGKCETKRAAPMYGAAQKAYTKTMRQENGMLLNIHG